MKVADDVLGIYRYRERERGFITSLAFDEADGRNETIEASVNLYWGVIGLVARIMNVAVEDLTIIVLAHELAHAYTHLGFDIDGP